MPRSGRGGGALLASPFGSPEKEQGMNRIGLEYITLLGMPPLEFIRIAAATGCGHVALFAAQSEYNPEGYPDYSLVTDRALRRDVARCLKDEGVSVALVDGFAVFRDRPIEAHWPALDMLAEIGATRINTVSFDAPERTVDETAKLVEKAASYGLTVTVEPCPVLTTRTLAEAIVLIEAVALPNFKLLIDTMHVSRTGEAGRIATLDPQLIDYVQISDGPLAMPATDAEYMDEAMNERRIPGDGEMPLVEMLRSIRPEVVVSAEVPQRSLRDAGVSSLDRARRVIAGTRRVLDAAG
jgi:sugar phosphate isomerase/epimerase